MPPLAGFWRRAAGQLIDSVVVSVLSAVGPLGLFLSALYWVGMLAIRGQTLGMMAVGVKIVRAADGGAIDLRQSIVRFLMALVSGACFGLGYLWAAWDRERRTWHDRVAGTLAVDAGTVGAGV